MLLKEMNLDEKMAQLVGVFAIKGAEDRMAAFFKNGIGQISSLEFRSCDSLEEVAAWQRQLQTMIVLVLAKAAGVTEALKATDQMKWVGIMNDYKAQAEEIFFQEIICAEK